MQHLSEHDPDAEPLSAGARYCAHLSRYPERSDEPPARRWWRDFLRALRFPAWWSLRRRRLEGH